MRKTTKLMYLITDEFNEGVKDREVTCYGKVDILTLNDIVDGMERYSLCDYCDYDEIKTEREYLDKIETYRKLGCKIIRKDNND